MRRFYIELIVRVWAWDVYAEISEVTDQTASHRRKRCYSSLKGCSHIVHAYELPRWCLPREIRGRS